MSAVVGDVVQCEAGHIIADVVRPIDVETPLTAELFANWRQRNGLTGVFPYCAACGLPVVRGDWQVAIAGKGWQP